MPERHFPPHWTVEELDALLCRDGRPGGSFVESLRLIQMRSSAFSFEGSRVVSIIVLMAANAVEIQMRIIHDLTLHSLALGFQVLLEVLERGA